MGDGTFPFASIAIPVRNEEAAIESCLAAVAAQDYPHDRLEVLVVDGGSTDRTRKLVERFAEHSPVAIRVLDNPAGTTPAGLNRALAAARGEFFVRVDGHSEPQPNYVRRCVGAAVELDAGLAGGWVEPVGRTAFGRAVAAAFRSPFSMGNAVSWRQPGEPRQVASVPCGAYRASLLRAIGGFDEEQRANQDYEANYRLRAAGGTVWILPDVSFAYVPRSSLRPLVRQFFRYGFYKARTIVKHPSSARPRQLVPAAALVGGIALAAASPFSGVALVALVVCAALYLLAIAAACAAAARSLDGPATLRLPLVFAAMHLAWGAGNLLGLARWLPWRRTIRQPLEALSA